MLISVPFLFIYSLTALGCLVCDSNISVNGQKRVTLDFPLDSYPFHYGDLLRITCYSSSGRPYFRNLQDPPININYRYQLSNNANETILYVRPSRETISIDCVLSDLNPDTTLRLILLLTTDLPDLIGFEVNGERLRSNLWIGDLRSNTTYEYYPGEMIHIKLYSYKRFFTGTSVICNVSSTEPCRNNGRSCHNYNISVKDLDLKIEATTNITKYTKNDIICDIYDPSDGSVGVLQLFLVLDNFLYSPYISGMSMSKIKSKYKESEIYTTITYSYTPNEVLTLDCQYDLFNNVKKSVFYEYLSEHVEVTNNHTNENKNHINVRLRANHTQTVIVCYYIENSVNDLPFTKVRTQVYIKTAGVESQMSQGFEHGEDYNNNNRFGMKRPDYMNSVADYLDKTFLNISNTLHNRNSYPANISINQSIDAEKHTTSTSTLAPDTRHRDVSYRNDSSSSLYKTYNNYSSTTTNKPTTSTTTTTFPTTTVSSTTSLNNLTLEDPNAGYISNESNEKAQERLSPILTFENKAKLAAMVIFIVIVPLVSIILYIIWRVRRKRIREATNRNKTMKLTSNPASDIDHIYETIPDPIYDDPVEDEPTSAVDMSQRPPQPLPPEAQNKRYIHYDTPYDFRIFRIGVPVMYVPSRFKKTCRQV